MKKERYTVPVSESTHMWLFQHTREWRSALNREINYLIEQKRSLENEENPELRALKIKADEAESFIKSEQKKVQDARVELQALRSRIEDLQAKEREKLADQEASGQEEKIIDHYQDLIAREVIDPDHLRDNQNTTILIEEHEKKFGNDVLTFQKAIEKAAQIKHEEVVH